MNMVDDNYEVMVCRVIGKTYQAANNIRSRLQNFGYLQICFFLSYILTLSLFYLGKT